MMLAGCKSDRLIKFGDLVIVYERFNHMRAVTVSKDADLQNRYGVFSHNDWVGKQFGCKVFGRKGGFVYLLAPNPHLWTLVLSHRTQILYIADISFVLAYLEVRPGSVVFESGTGSGSLTTALARAAAPTGHVHTFDFHEQRALAARKDFETNGLSKFVSVTVRDIQGTGFPIELAGEVDAAFLDLPQPWLAVPSVAVLLKGDSPMCSFSPCIEQVQRTCEALSNPAFTDIRTFEVLLRTYEVHEEFLNTSLGILSDDSCTPVNSPPCKRVCSRDSKASEAENEHRVSNCCNRHSVLDCQEVVTGTNSNEQQVAEVQETIAKNSKRPSRRTNDSRHSKVCVVARPEPETKGHTGYLTFARRSV